MPEFPDNSALRVREIHGTVAELHAEPMPTDGDQAELWLMRPHGVAVAMGSSQQPDLFDEQRLEDEGIALAPRRSGGGAVYIDPASIVWIDVVAPRSSPLWSAELGENFLIVGRLWQQALATLGVNAELCMAPPVRTDAAALACWAGSGWGELLIGQAKIVGLSQRRTRWGSRVQAMAVIDSSSSRIVDYLTPDLRPTVEATIPTVDLAITTAALESAVVAAFRRIS